MKDTRCLDAITEAMALPSVVAVPDQALCRMTNPWGLVLAKRRGRHGVNRARFGGTREGGRGERSRSSRPTSTHL